MPHRRSALGAHSASQRAFAFTALDSEDILAIARRGGAIFAKTGTAPAA